jgi:ribonuclease HIII
VKPLTSYTVELDAVQARELEAWLRAHDYVFREVPYARYAAERDRTNVVCYQVQGRGTQEFVEFVLEPEILKQAVVGYEAVLNPDMLLPRIGIDESGKGDFFGPLCVAAVYVNQEMVERWKEAGVRDSKSIGSERRVKDLAELIRGTAGAAVDVVAIGNPAYNRLHAKLGSVNSILAWGHARVLENLMARKMNPPPVRAISDQFASSKRTVEQALMGIWVKRCPKARGRRWTRLRGGWWRDMGWGYWRGRGNCIFGMRGRTTRKGKAEGRREKDEGSLVGSVEVGMASIDKCV